MISMLCPTRGRPEKLERLYKSLVETTSGEFELLLGIDEDDARRSDYLQLAMKYQQIVMKVGSRRSAPCWVNDLVAFSRGNLVFTGADDMESKTKDWDKIVRGMIPKDDVFVGTCQYGGGEPTFVGIGWITAVGFIQPSGFDHWYCTTVLYDAAMIVHRKLDFPISWVEERHGHGQGVFWDDTYEYHVRDAYKHCNSDGEKYKTAGPVIAESIARCVNTYLEGLKQKEGVK